MKEEKLEQLKVVFKTILAGYVTIGSWNMKEVVAKLIYEVKIRATERKE